MNAVRLPCRGVLFDCDGVLVDSVASGQRGWSQWATDYGLDHDAVLSGVHGRRSAETVAMHVPAVLREEALRRIDAIELADAGSTTAIPGALELTSTLAANWAVVTSAAPALLRARLTTAGLLVPSVTVTAADVTLGKPDPEGYLRAAAGLGFAIGDCIVIEDSPTGITAGRSAGAGYVIGVGASSRGTGAEPVIRDLRGVRWDGEALLIAASALL